MVTQPVAVALGIPVSRWILDNIHWAGLAGWRWVFILEGVTPLAMGLVTLFYLTDRPEEARWLPKDEKAWLMGELKAEADRKTSEGRVHVMAALRNPQTFLLIALFFLIVNGNQALIIFLPSITDSMKGMPGAVRAVAAGLPYACSACGIWINGVWANRTGELRWHTAVPILATAISLGLTVLASGNAWLMLSLFCLAGFTSQAYLAPFFTLPTVMLGKTAAATAVGTDQSGKSGRVRGAVAVRISEDGHRAVRYGIVGVSRMHADGGPVGHPDKSAVQETI